MTVLLFLITLSSSFSAPQPVDHLVAAVNSSLILFSDLQRFRQTVSLRAQIDPLFGGTALARKGAAMNDDEILNFLIEEKIMLSEIPVKDGEVEQEINSIQSTNNITRESLTSALRSQGFKFDDYFELIRISIAKRSVIERDIRTKVHISEDDIKNHYYNKLKSSDASPDAGLDVSYHVQMITVNARGKKSKTDVLKTIQAAHADLLAGSSFLEVSKKYSDHPNADSGGDLGTLKLAEMSPDIRKQVEKLKAGQNSEILGSDKSKFFILRVVDVRSEPGDGFLKEKEKILNELSAAEYQQQLLLWLDRQKAKSFILKYGQSSIPAQNIRKKD